MILKSFYVGAIVLTCTAAPALAAGAIAVGECDRAGWSKNYETESGARQRALSECRANGDRTCVIRVECRTMLVAPLPSAAAAVRAAGHMRNLSGVQSNSHFRPAGIMAGPTAG